MSSIGQKLRYLREKNCLKQEDIAQYLNVSRASISKYESGVREPDIDTVKALAKYYNVPVDYIFGLTDSAYNFEDNLVGINFEDTGFIRENRDIISPCDYGLVLDLIKDEKFLRFAKKIKDNNLDLETIENIIDNIILLNKNRKKS